MTEILNFIKKRANYLALIFLLVFLLSTFFSIHGNFWEGLKLSGFALTSDEADFIPIGFYYLKTQQYFFLGGHPSLIPTVTALPLLFLNLNLPEISKENESGDFRQVFGRPFLFQAGNDPDLITFWSRTVIILLNGLLLFLIYYFLKKIVGVLPSLAALFFFVFSPNLTAHASLVTMDVPLSLLSLLSIIIFSLFLKDLTGNAGARKNFILAVIFTSLALLTKIPAILLFVGLFFGGLTYVLFTKRSFWGKYLRFFIFFSFLILIFIGTFQGIETINLSVETFQYWIGLFKFPLLVRGFLHQVASFDIFVLNGMIQYFLGIIAVTRRIIIDPSTTWPVTYFLGNIYGPGEACPAYFPTLFFAKETLGFLILLFLAVFSFAWSFWKNNELGQKVISFFNNPFNAVCLIFVLIYGFFVLKFGTHIGVRYIFPITFLFYVLVAKRIVGLASGEATFFKKKIKLSFALLLIFLTIMTSWVITWPYYLSYYNILAGGTKEGYKIATDSNYDWVGQDVKRLGKWVKDNKIEKIYCHIFANFPLDYYLGEAYQPFNIRHDPLPPKGSLLAVSAFEMQNINYDKDLPESQKYLQFQENLVERVGTTIFIFQVQ